MATDWTPSRAAYHLTHVLNSFAAAHGTPRFPIDVDSLALEAARLFHWSDAITEIQSADIRHFEGALFPGPERKKWLLLYNHRIASSGRIRFTKAHELGHYVLHRTLHESFSCTEQDMLSWSDDIRGIEAQADLFASTLLMPLDDFRVQITQIVDFDLLGHCADRYGTSLTATTLKWLDSTDENAVLVVSRDGFIRWAHSSNRAMDAGAFFRSRSSPPLSLPDRSLAADERIDRERYGVTIDANIWFPNAEPGEMLRELKISADQYDSVMTLLVLPRHARVWPRWKSEDCEEI
ncbi:ImmA/IrrE family metallo-endopeptidase [Rhodanobacter sp. OR87]|uniref:ImmA/IrrE family metallo-endopeptidase n=1 Tax=Rhodanobacter sp. OR87 TaxID=1076523 RepID=UPI000415E57F|nr:ImmA/IrrE family metallo-endopeptidase [Rhodanobacter sp. OR87]